MKQVAQMRDTGPGQILFGNEGDCMHPGHWSMLHPLLLQLNEAQAYQSLMYGCLCPISGLCSAQNSELTLLSRKRVLYGIWAQNWGLNSKKCLEGANNEMACPLFTDFSGLIITLISERCNNARASQYLVQISSSHHLEIIILKTTTWTCTCTCINFLYQCHVPEKYKGC